MLRMFGWKLENDEVVWYTLKISGVKRFSQYFFQLYHGFLDGFLKKFDNFKYTYFWISLVFSLQKLFNILCVILVFLDI